MITIKLFNGKTYDDVKSLKRNYNNGIYQFVCNGRREIVLIRDVNEIIDSNAKDEPVLKGLF